MEPRCLGVGPRPSWEKVANGRMKGRPLALTMGKLP
jgi:hypothetical protein